MTAPTFVPSEKSRAHQLKAGVARYYFGEYHSSARGPQGFLNESNPDGFIRPHFHYENQFQLFFGTPGSTFQRREITRLLLHYSEAGTAYGPIEIGSEGLHFFTLRQNGNDSTGYMPDDKDLLDPARRRRHLQVDLSSWMIEPTADGEAVSEQVLPEQNDTLGAVAIRAGKGAKVVPPAPSGANGQYYVVVDGSLESDGDELGPLALGWCDPGDPTPTFVAGENGAHLLVLQFGEESDFHPSMN